MRMSGNETLSAFLERYRRNYRTMLDLDDEEMPPEVQAVDFLMKLHSESFSELVRQCRNRAIAWPETLAEAYTLASNYIPAKASKSASQAPHLQAVFTTATEDKKGADSKGGKGNKGKGKGNAQQAGGGGKAVERKRFCKLCDSTEHWDNQCPYRPLLREIVQKQKAATTDTALPENVAVLLGLEDMEVVLPIEKLGREAFGDTDVLLDNEASIHVFRNPRFLTNIRPANVSVVVKGAGGSTRLDRVGTSTIFGDVFYDPTMLANIVSFSKIRRVHPVGYNQEENYFSSMKTGIIENLLREVDFMSATFKICSPKKSWHRDWWTQSKKISASTLNAKWKVQPWRAISFAN